MNDLSMEMSFLPGVEPSNPLEASTPTIPFTSKASSILSTFIPPARSTGMSMQLTRFQSKVVPVPPDEAFPVLVSSNKAIDLKAKELASARITSSAVWSAAEDKGAGMCNTLMHGALIKSINSGVS